MLEYTPVDNSGNPVGEKVTLQQGQSNSLELFGHTRRKKLAFTFDYTGIVSATASEKKFAVRANPSTIKNFESGGEMLSHALEIGQEIVYTYRGKLPAEIPANAILGVRVKRLVAPAVSG